MKMKLLLVCAICLLIAMPLVSAQTQPAQLQQKNLTKTGHISVTVSDPSQSFCYTEPPVPIVNNEGKTIGYVSVQVGGGPGPVPLSPGIILTYIRWIRVTVLSVFLIPQVWEKTYGIFRYSLSTLRWSISPATVTQGTYRPLVWHCDGVEHIAGQGIILVAYLLGEGYYYNNQYQDGYAYGGLFVAIGGSTDYEYDWEGPGWLNLG